MTAITSKSTKAALLTHIGALDAQLIAKGREAQVLRNELSMLRTRPTPQLALYSQRDRTAYYQYVNAQRRASFAAGHKVTSYKTFSDWSAA